jgi:hypothetical protein
MFSLDAVLADTPVASLWAGVGLGAPDKENFALMQKLFIRYAVEHVFSLRRPYFSFFGLGWI